jgi:hypothetical protein
MPSSFRTRQAGEGKVGCFITLVVLIVGIAVGIKAIPVYYSNNEFVKACSDDIAPNASRASEDQVLERVRSKAKELDIPEALQPGAIRVSVVPSSGDNPGNVHIGLKYGRTVDFYGVCSYTFQTDESVDSVIYTNIK